MPSILPSPAVSIVGRHNSGKTTLVEKIIARLSSLGLDVGSVKHHGHSGFEIDVPGKDSYRHRAAGATETFISAPGQIAMIKTISKEMECRDIVGMMPGHDIVIVEGYRLSGLPAIEVMRSGNERDRAVAHAFLEASCQKVSLSCDILQHMRNEVKGLPSIEDDLSSKVPGSATVAIVSDIDEALEAAKNYGIPSFGLDDIEEIAGFLNEEYVRPRLTVAIQAGGESRRMGQSKAMVPFAGRPLIERIVERVLPVADEIIVTTNEPDRLRFLQDEYPWATIRLVEDEFDQRGALLGLHTAFKAASHPFVAVVACDMVNVSSKLIALEFEKVTRSSADVCIPRNSHGREPFHALYRRESCLHATVDCLADGQKRAQSILDNLSVIELSRNEVLDVDPRGGCFVNVNTPEELAKAEKSFAFNR